MSKCRANRFNGLPPRAEAVETAWAFQSAIFTGLKPGADENRRRGHEICGLAVMPFGNSRSESQGDSGLKPRVARNEPPWDIAANGETTPRIPQPRSTSALELKRRQKRLMTTTIRRQQWREMDQKSDISQVSQRRGRLGFRRWSSRNTKMGGLATALYQRTTLFPGIAETVIT